MENIIEGKVVSVIDETTIVINKGCADGVTNDNRFLIYNLGGEMFDPDTKESLGKLELVCGEGKPSHIQNHLTTLTSCRFEIINNKTIKKNAFLPFGEVEEIHNPERFQLPFEKVTEGSLVRQIK